MNKRNHRQQDLFRADTRFFLMLSSLLTDENEEGKTRLAEIGAYGLAVLVCLRCGADFDTGLVSIGQREIARQTGIRQQTAGEYLSKLIELGYVQKLNDDGKRGLYKLTDHINIEHDDKPAGKMMLPYSPRKMGELIHGVKTFLKNGQLPDDVINAGVQVSININITNIQNAEHVYFGEREEQTNNYNDILSLPDSPMRKLAITAIREQLDRLEKE